MERSMVMEEQERAITVRNGWVESLWVGLISVCVWAVVMMCIGSLIFTWVEPGFADVLELHFC